MELGSEWQKRINLVIDKYREALNKLSSSKHKSINEIEELLGFDKVKPIILTSSDAEQLEDDAEYFKIWYEEELRKLWSESK